MEDVPPEKSEKKRLGNWSKVKIPEPDHIDLSHQPLESSNSFPNMSCEQMLMKQKVVDDTADYLKKFSGKKPAPQSKKSSTFKFTNMFGQEKVRKKTEPQGGPEPSFKIIPRSQPNDQVQQDPVRQASPQPSFKITPKSKKGSAFNFKKAFGTTVKKAEKEDEEVKKLSEKFAKISTKEESDAVNSKKLEERIPVTEAAWPLFELFNTDVLNFPDGPIFVT